ncbi:ankyrin repeat protein [Oesophagostomum dentatum]|uniref:Ankyrin repeat protein n=1 Tax=Oesophagostomum dentatum TaxID=61180 RepID=A0A0B1TGU0_OESDE|nr:ankyrin repeat protein [Oesophagostomum dentatum]
MHSMACGGSMEMLAVLREAGAKINVRDVHGKTVAHYAAMASHTELLKSSRHRFYLIISTLGLLIEIDKDFVNATDNEGYTPLHYAVQTGQNTKTIELLLEHGSNILAAAKDGTTALHIAATLAESAIPIEYLVKVRNIS